MPFGPHLRIVMSGNLTSEVQAEVWACAINAVPGSGATTDFDGDAYLAAVHASLATWFHAPTSHIGATATLQFLKINAIGADGRYATPATPHTYEFSPEIVGAGTDNNPDIISLRTSWQTARRRGPGSHGGIYLPNYTLGDGVHMSVDPGGQAIARDAGKALLTLLSAPSGGLTVHPVIASKVDASNTAITGVTVGNILDVQRRRKNRLKETYLASPWP